MARINKDSVLYVRVSEKQKEDFETLGYMSGRSMSCILRKLLDEQYEKFLETGYLEDDYARNKDRKNKVICIRIDRVSLKKLDELSDATGYSISELVRFSIGLIKPHINAYRNRDILEYEYFKPYEI